MRVTVLHNPSSGRGSRADAADRICDRLRRDRHDATPLDARTADESAIEHALRDTDALVVAGGDGTVHYAAPAAIRTGTPVYHLPLGTENLFAREFGMDRRLDTLSKALRHGKVVEVDVGECNGRAFLIMCSAGFDACVVQRVARARSGAVHKLDYVVHGLRELLSPRHAPLSISVDGRPLVEGQAGLVVVANSRQYAARLDPARDASPTDGLLDAFFFPFQSRLGLLAWGLQIKLGRHLRDPRLRRARGSRVTISASPQPALPGGLPHQLDGEAADPMLARLGAPLAQLALTIRPRALRVLTPA